MQENPNLYIIREAISHSGYQPFDSTKASQAVHKIITPVQTKEVGLIRRNSPEILKRLNEVITRLGIAKTDIKPAALSASYATDAAVDLFGSNAIRAQQEQSLALFILFFDTDFGASMGAHPILAVTRPGLAKTIPDLATILADSAESQERFFGKVASIPDQAATYVRMQAERSRWAALFNETTSKNPEGFLLMAEITKQLKGLPNRLGSNNLPNHFVPQFVSAGADFSRVLFRAIYPISEQFIASK